MLEASDEVSWKFLVLSKDKLCYYSQQIIVNFNFLCVRTGADQVNSRPWYYNHPDLPFYTWDIQKFGKSSVKKSSQRWMALMVGELFPGKEIIEDYMHPEMVFSSQRKMQIDVFVPAYSLAFEYNGLQHYQDIGFFSPQATYKLRDDEKKAACAARKITLVEVPFWWNRSQDSLAASIKAIRPDVPLPDFGSAAPIPLEFSGQATAVSTNFNARKQPQTE